MFAFGGCMGVGSYLRFFVLCCLAVIFSSAGAQNISNSFDIKQKELKAMEVTYKIGGIRGVSLPKGMVGDNSIHYSLSADKNKAGSWRLFVTFADDGESIMEFDVLMDSKANVCNEKTKAVGAGKREKGKFRRRGRDGFEFVFGAKTDRREYVQISEEDIPFIGKSKVISVKNDQDDKAIEVLVDPNEIVTTMMQIVVWAGTLGEVPATGIPVRWITDGKPFPVILKERQEMGASALAIYPNTPVVTADKAPEALMTFVFSEKKADFSFPEKMILKMDEIEVEYCLEGVIQK